jgi:hypothetical protein
VVGRDYEFHNRVMTPEIIKLAYAEKQFLKKAKVALRGDKVMVKGLSPGNSCHASLS